MQVKITYKKIKNFILRIRPTYEICLSVPHHATQKEITHFLQKNQEWIKKHLEKLHALKQDLSDMHDGEKIAYLGKTYLLKVIASSMQDININGEFLEIYTPKINDFEHQQKLLKVWYQERAKECFIPLVYHYASLIGEEVRAIRVKPMQTRWGSCNPKKAYINLNLWLIQKELKSIEYVILHELAHLKYPHHRQEFWDFIGLYMSDWKERKLRLR